MAKLNGAKEPEIGLSCLTLSGQLRSRCDLARVNIHELIDGMARPAKEPSPERFFDSQGRPPPPEGFWLEGDQRNRTIWTIVL
jgi:hypothetical protein